MITTDRLIIRPWQLSDAEALFKYASDERVCELAMWPRHESVEMSRLVIEKFFMTNPDCFAIVLKATNEPIGSIGLVPFEDEHYALADEEREVGYWIGHPYWGMGITSEALQRMIEYWPAVHSVKSLVITAGASNFASQRVAEKCGFRWIEDYSIDSTPSKAYRLYL